LCNRRSRIWDGDFARIFVRALIEASVSRLRNWELTSSSSSEILEFITIMSWVGRNLQEAAIFLKISEHVDPDPSKTCSFVCCEFFSHLNIM
jgi:hypothetical protein